MVIDWNTQYTKILKEFKYNETKDIESAAMLDSLLSTVVSNTTLTDIIKDKTAIIVGSGPSLHGALDKLKNYSYRKRSPSTIIIAADSSIKSLVRYKIIPDIVVSDLDGDHATLLKLGKIQNCIIIVHAHGDNMDKLLVVKKFKSCVGTTQSKPIGKIQNFGGFTDGDRSVFLASHFGAKKIILVGMDFGSKIGSLSDTNKSDKSIKRLKLKWGQVLLEWLATTTKSDLYTTSRTIQGFKRISCQDL